MVKLYFNTRNSGGAVGKSIRKASGSLGVRIPAATDFSRKNSTIQCKNISTAKRSELDVSAKGPERRPL